MNPKYRIPSIIGALTAALLTTHGVEAGPALICGSFATAQERLLPWGEGRSWNSPDRTYDVERLTHDTLGLLSADTPVSVRLENLRRATIYAAHDARLARELLAAVIARAHSAAEPAPSRALALLDAGMLIESYRQITGPDMPEFFGADAALASHVHALDAYGLIERAIARAPERRAEIERAAALMTR